jgi:hypothetical protein
MGMNGQKEIIWNPAKNGDMHIYKLLSEFYGQPNSKCDTFEPY